MVIGDWHRDMADSEDEFSWLDLPAKFKYWGIQVENLAVGGHKITENRTNMLVDSGTSFVVLSEKTLVNYIAQIHFKSEK